MRKTPLSRSTPLRRSGRPTRKGRKPSEFARIYGSEARVEWVKSRPCLVCGPTSWCRSDNAHVVTGGMGRKADARFIVPLCPNHHQSLHKRGVRTFEQRYGIDLLAAAAATEAAWQQQQQRGAA